MPFHFRPNRSLQLCPPQNDRCCYSTRQPLYSVDSAFPEASESYGMIGLQTISVAILNSISVSILAPQVQSMI
ncbi:hypothetical protein GGQ85_002931 [Nitrobacter vulgaris]|nr:hypothetical protein [Nitrobacter vulgaris]